MRPRYQDTSLWPVDWSWAIDRTYQQHGVGAGLSPFLLVIMQNQYSTSVEMKHEKGQEQGSPDENNVQC